MMAKGFNWELKMLLLLSRSRVRWYGGAAVPYPSRRVGSLRQEKDMINWRDGHHESPLAISTNKC